MKDNKFLEVVQLIKNARYNALKAVNSEIVALYWKIGEHISKKIETSEWGNSVVEELAEYIKKKYPELKGYDKRSLFRMRQFYEIYHKNEKVSALLTQLSWTNNLAIFSKTAEEREFYINLCIKEKYSSRELERQIDSCVYERSMLSQKLSPVVREMRKDVPFKDTYVLEFLNLPEKFDEKDLRKALIKNFKNFVLELEKDFALVGEEFRIQVGNNDYCIDLVFYHRELKCLVAIELKVDDFKPEYLGKLNFYLEALDRDVKKKHENPSVGIILCKTKDKEVVEYSLSRSMSAALVAEYKTKLIGKEILQRKLHELVMLLG